LEILTIPVYPPKAFSRKHAGANFNTNSSEKTLELV